MILVAHARDYGDKALVLMLKIDGFDAALVSSGTEALEFLHRNKPELLLLNGTLEDVDALDLLRVVRADPDLAGLPVCLMSSDCRRAEEAKPLGIDAFLHKPFFAEELFQVAERFACRTDFHRFGKV